MRIAACIAWQNLFTEHRFAFLTGDLGFMALEPLRDEMAAWFINAGVAEQNMVSVAAGMSKLGIETWVYSIAPFIYARPFEQIRNDVCLNHLPVKIVGNGGGYAYGSMGSSHHAIEDYGVLLGLQEMQIFVPAFDEDVETIIYRMSASTNPGYLRLGRCEKPSDLKVAAYAPWRCLLQGGGPTIVAIGPIAGALMVRVSVMDEATRPNLWVLTEMPLGFQAIPEELINKVRMNAQLLVVEEHVAQGSAGHALVTAFASKGIAITNFIHCCAEGYPSGTYGSQTFHRRESRMDADTVLTRLAQKCAQT
jgi:transketolase